MSTKVGRARRVRYGVIGLGHIAQVAVLPAFRHARENSELVALISSDQAKLKTLGERHRIRQVCRYEDFESLASSGAMDAVYIALPNHLHREWTERAAAQGLHVLCEKPMALDPAECAAMIKAAARHEVRLMIAYRLHFEAANLRAIELVRGGAIGEPRFFSSVFGHLIRRGNVRTRAELGGGALYDLGVYCINAARSLFDAEPIEVFGIPLMGAGGRAGNVDEITTAILRFPEDRIAQFTVSQGTSSVSHYRVSGTRGDLVLEPAYDYSVGLKMALTVHDKTTRERFPMRDQFAPELIHFSRCILEDRDPEPSGREGWADVRVINALLESARLRRPVALPSVARVRHPRASQQLRRPPIRKPRTVHAASPSVG